MELLDQYVQQPSLCLFWFRKYPPGPDAWGLIHTALSIVTSCGVPQLYQAESNVN